MHPLLATLLICNLILVRGSSNGHQSVTSASPDTTPVTSVFYSEPALSEAPAIQLLPYAADLNGAEDDDNDDDHDDYVGPHAPDEVHSVEKRDLNERIRHMAHEKQRAAAAAAAIASTGNHSHITGCQTCRKVHMDLREATREHIRSYMLARLGFNVSGPPKPRESWPAVPPYILESFLTSQSNTNSGNWEEWNEERINHQNQQKYLDSFPGTALDPDYMGDEPSWTHRTTAGLQQDDEGPKVKTTRIFLFPNMTKLRHQSNELMSFEFPATMSKRKKTHPPNWNDYGASHSALNPLLYLDVTRALLHISFCNEHDSTALLDDLRSHLSRKSPFRVTVHRLVVKEHRNFSSERFSKEEVTIEVPINLLEAVLAEEVERISRISKGGSAPEKKLCKHYINLDVTQMVKDWYKSSKKNHGLFVTVEPARLKNLLTLKPTENKPFLELWTVSSRKKRVKRSINLQCKEEDQERRCCMYPLTVDFEKFGWDFIIAPKKYEANYCAGECAINFQTSYTHTHVMQLATSSPACCAPKQMNSLKLLYFNRKDQVMQTELENMIVETCACS